MRRALAGILFLLGAVLGGCGSGVPPVPAPAVGDHANTQAVFAAPAVLTLSHGPGRLVGEWDFTSGEESPPWLFGKGGSAWSAGGWVLAPFKDGPVTIGRGLTIPAAEVDRVELDVLVEHVRPDGATVVNAPKVIFYWARAGEVAAAGTGWPFDNNRAVPMEPGASNDSTVWAGKLTGAPRWEGEIVSAFFGVNCGDDPAPVEGEFYRVHVYAVRFLKQSGNEARSITRAESTGEEVE